ncbi:TetR/AcrR family transcriptional regulator [Nocardioides flavescens]|uniref:TetR family transcriptional regulator n=1 Tax=Nocardioides flavescens TaxID=2691959 RepID=A0A6L7ESI1_9ACTN|nr:TetR/AcrR family transcriptional regulator [Nocardioides flavescens]MXG90273.1 TetR family transcriptional regulator [Nocardioides flavescens]
MSGTTAERIVREATRLLAAGGREAVSTRAVAAAAGVQAPTIYRLFGDKQGLLDAVAQQGYADYVADKLTRAASDDPVEDLRRGWQLHLEFAVANPALYVLMTEPRLGDPGAVVAAGVDFLRAIIRRIAEQGRLAVPEEHALLLFRAGGHGATLMVLEAPDRAVALAVAEQVREATIGALTTDAPVTPGPGPAGAAIALRAQVDDVTALNPAERTLLVDWLDRIAAPGQDPAGGA